MTLTDEEFKLFRNLIYEESGIYLKEARKEFLENRLVKRMTATGIKSPYWYYRFLVERRKTELLVLLDLLTINETSFFRNKPQMELFRNITMQEMITKRQSDIRKRLKIWSAGCATGEEPYSIAMVILEALSQVEDWDVKIFASDLSLTALKTASRGEYPDEKVHSTVDDYYIPRYFSKNGDCYKVNDKVRKFVIFDFHNLKNDNGICGLDFIFCRNVMMYFDIKEQKRLINKFYHSLNPGGYLLIGHAESLQGMNTGFRFLYDNGATAYRKPEEGELC